MSLPTVWFKLGFKVEANLELRVMHFEVERGMNHTCHRRRAIVLEWKQWSQNVLHCIAIKIPWYLCFSECRDTALVALVVRV
jgi:hypothetical protein